MVYWDLIRTPSIHPQLKQGNPHFIMAKHLIILSLLLFTDFAPFT